MFTQSTESRCDGDSLGNHLRALKGILATPPRKDFEQAYNRLSCFITDELIAAFDCVTVEQDSYQIFLSITEDNPDFDRGVELIDAWNVANTQYEAEMKEYRAKRRLVEANREKWREYERYLESVSDAHIEELERESIRISKQIAEIRTHRSDK